MSVPIPAGFFCWFLFFGVLCVVNNGNVIFRLVCTLLFFLFHLFCCVYVRCLPTFVNLSSDLRTTAAGLRRSFRLRKDRQGGSPVEPRTPDATQTDFLIYEEVTRYQTRRGERSRLIVLIGRIALCDHHFVSENPVGRIVYRGLGCRTPGQNGFGWNPNILRLPVESSYVTCLWLPYLIVF